MRATEETDELIPEGHDRTADAMAGARLAGVRLWHRWHLGALLMHLALAAIFTWPLVANFLPGAGTATPGTLVVDRDQNLWNLWWVRQAVLGGHNPFVTDMIYYPTPVSLYYHTLNLFNGLLAIPLLSIFSLTTTYNLIVLFSFVMGGYGAFLLVHYLCGNRWAALTGSVVFTYSAYHIATMRGLLQMISLEWVPFFLLFLLKAVYTGWSPSWRGVGPWLLKRALPAALALFFVSLVDWYYTMYSLMLAGLLGLYLVARYLWGMLRRISGPSPIGSLATPLARLVLCIAIYLIFVSPILVPTLSELRNNSYVQPQPEEAIANSADLLTFLQPVRGQLLWGSLFTNRDKWPYASNRYEVYFTYTALFLAGVGLFRVRQVRPLAASLHEGGRQSNNPQPQIPQTQPSDELPGKWFWATCVLIFFLLALGPVLQVNGRRVEWLFTPGLKLPMPYKLIEGLPVLNISRSPDRFDMPLTLCLGVLAGYGSNVLINTWWRRFQPGTRGLLLSLGAIALIGVELTPVPYPQRPADIPRWYAQLAKEPGDFSILELPPQDEYWHGAYRMYFQTEHGKRIFGGYISREFPHPFLASTPGYQELVTQAGEPDIFSDGTDQWYSAFAQYNTRYIVLQKDRLPDRVEVMPDVSQWRDSISKVLGSTPPVYSDEQLDVYSVPKPARQVPFLSLGDGWQPLEKDPTGTPFRWMGDAATLRIDAPARENAYLVFRATTVGPPRTLRIVHGDQVVFDGKVGPLQSYKIGPLGLPQGASYLTIGSPDGTVVPAQLGLGNDRRQLGFALMGVALEEVK